MTLYTPNPGEFHEATPTAGLPSSSHESQRTTSVHFGTSLHSESWVGSRGGGRRGGGFQWSQMALWLKPEVEGDADSRHGWPLVTFLHCEAGCKPESLGNWRKGALEPGREETGFYLWVTSSTQAQATATESCCLLAPCRLALSLGLPTSPAGRSGFSSLHPAPPSPPFRHRDTARPLPEPGNPQSQPHPTST